MDSKNQTANKIPALRTYASDLENNRKVPVPLPPSKESTPDEPEEKAPVEAVKIVRDENIIVKPSEHKAQERKPEEAKSLPPLSSIKSKKNNQTKVVSANPKATTFLVEEGGDSFNATIITDTKRGRFKLLPSIVKSISSWFAEKKRAYELRKVPRYTVPETTRRKGVIQKATGVTGKLTTSDFSSIQERIKRRKEEDEKPEPTTTWTANTEPGFLLLENHELPKISNITVVPRKSFRNPPPSVKVSAPEEKKPEVVAEKAVVPEVVTIKNTANELASVPPPVAEPPAPIVPPVEPAETPVAYDQPDEVNPVVEPVEAKTPFRILSLNTNILAIGIFGLIFALIISSVYLYFVLTAPVVYISNDTSIETVPILDAPIKFVAGATNDAPTLIKALEVVSSEVTETTQIGLLFSGSKTTLIPAQILISIFKFSLDKQFYQSISQLRLGYTANKNPFLVMKISDPTTARGSLLEWEKQMPNDLANLLSLPKESLSDSKFTDASLEGVDVRVLKNPAGLELILYGIKNNTIIIAASTADFSELLKLVK